VKKFCKLANIRNIIYYINNVNPIKNKKDLETISEAIRVSAYNYLEKYSPSKQQLRIYLLKKFLKKQIHISNKKDLLYLIDIIISDLEKNKFLSDKFYSDSKTKLFLKRGYSLNKIRHSLIQKGVETKYIDLSISKIKEKDMDTDFFSALKICKKRRIGAIRDQNNRPLFYKKDLAFLARSGFSYETSKKILDISKEEFNKLIKLI